MSKRTEDPGPKREREVYKGWLLLGFLLVVAGTGCGYHFLGAGEGLPKDIQTIYVEPFVNGTKEIGIERELAAAVKSDFHRRGQIRVVDRADKADAILTGVVRSFDTTVTAVNSSDEALEFETALVVDMTLRRRATDEILWRTQAARLSARHSASRGAVVTTSSDFKRGTLNAGDIPQFTDVQLTETLDYDTREKLVQEFARELHERLVERF